MIVKTREINDVREVLANNTAEAELALKQTAIVANWINSFAKGKRLLELGCGRGQIAELLSVDYCGIDPIRHEKLCEGFEFRTGSGENIPYRSDSFDYVLIKDAVNYFSNLRPVLEEASRVLRPQGVVLITEFVGPSYHPLKQKLKNLIKKYLKLRLNVWDKTYLNYYTSRDITATARSLGFTVKYEYSNADCRYYLQLGKRS
jgi:ubiquinone/menaquinone biosynthesis C-methylase UbiE